MRDGQILALNKAGGVAQFKSDGTLTPTVAGGAIIATAHTGITGFQPDGRFVLAQAVKGPRGWNDADVKAIRFEPAGGVDPTFNTPAFDFVSGGIHASAPQAV